MKNPLLALALFVSALLIFIVSSPAHAAVWYVNDTSTANDSFTSAIGFDTNAGTTPATPRRTISSIRSSWFAGDTIYIDAGLYAETVVLDTNALALIGADSVTTIINPPGESNVAGRYAIYAANKQGFLIRNLGLVDADQAIRFENVSYSVIEFDSVSNHRGGSGFDVGEILLTMGSSWNTIRGCYLAKSSQGIYIRQNGASSDNNIVESNVITNITSGGISLLACDSNVIRFNTVTPGVQGFSFGITASSGSEYNIYQGNVITAGAQTGMAFTGIAGSRIQGNRVSGFTYGGIRLIDSNDNTVSGNVSTGNGGYGLRLQNSIGNRVTQNDFIANNDSGIQIDATSSPDTITKNNLTGNTKGAVSALNPGSVAMSRNWWGTTDSALVRAAIKGAGGDSLAHYPYRLGPVDTAIGADTVAPRAPDTVAATTIDTQSIHVTWAVVTTSEETEGALGLGGYRIHRASSATASSWSQIVQTGPAVTSYIDSGLPDGVTFFYRVTAIDATVPWVNESFYSDSAPGAQTVNDTTNEWYVNDTSLTGDSFCTGIGADTNAGSPEAPFLTMAKALSMAVSGQTIFVDAGTYRETMTIETNALKIIGNDSLTTRFDFADSSGATAAVGLRATGRQNLLIRNIQIRNAWYGVLWSDVDSSILDRVTVRNCSEGLRIHSGSDSNSLLNVTSVYNFGTGLRIETSASNFVTAGDWAFNNGEGVRLQASQGCTILALVRVYPDRTGIHLVGSSGNLISGCKTVQSNLSDTAVWLEAGSHTNTITNNNSNTNRFAVVNSNFNTLSFNYVGSGMRSGFLLQNAHGNILDWDTVGSVTSGIELISSGGNLIRNCLSQYNSAAGFLLTSSDTNRFENNRAFRNTSHAFQLTNSNDNVFTQNVADSNLGWGWYLSGTSARDTFAKNAYATVARPDSIVFNGTANTFSFARNWWNTTDTAVIRGRVGGSGAGLVNYTPFRLAIVDTAPGADTVAPRAPDTVAVTKPGGVTMRVSWATVTGSEESETATALAGYRVYRAFAADTTRWDSRITVSAGTRSWDDTAALPLTTYYYRITAFDAKSPYPNESFYSDSIAVDSLPLPGMQAIIQVGLVQNFATDTRRVLGGIWLDSRSVASSRGFLVSRDSPVRIRVSEDSGTADTVLVEIDSGAGFVKAGETTFAGSMAILDLGSVWGAETNSIRITVGDTAIFPATATQETAIVIIDTAPPVVASSPFLPANGHIEHDASVNFYWYPITDSLSGVASRKIQVASDSAFAAIAIESAVSASAVGALLTLPGQATYYWRLQAVDSAGNIAASTGRLLQYAAPALTLPDRETHPFGLMMGVGVYTETQEIALARSLRAHYYRNNSVFADAWTGSDWSAAEARAQGFELILTVRANGGAGTPTNPPADLVDYANRIGSILDALRPKILVVENEENSSVFYTGSADSYRIQLEAAVAVAHGRGVPVANGGMVSLMVAGLTWDGYVREGNTAAANSFAARVFTPAEYAYLLADSGQEQLAGGRQFLEAHSAVDIDYVNCHWYIADTRAFQEARRFMETRTGRRLIVNEMGQKDSEATTVHNLMETVMSESIPRVIWYSSEAGISAVPLQNLDGSLRESGDSYIAFILARIDSTPPVAAVLTTPASRAETMTTSPVFAWTNGPDTQTGGRERRIQVDTSSGFPAPFRDSSVGNAAATTLTLPVNNIYFWRVASYDFANNVSYSDTRTLIIDTTPPVAATLSSPADDYETSATSMTFSWTAAVDTLAGVAGYRLQIDTSGTFASLLVDSAVGLATSALRTLSVNDSHYWRILATDSAGNWTVTTARVLLVDQYVAPVALAAPDHNTYTNDSTPTFAWLIPADSTGIDSFVLQMDTNPAFTAPLITDTRDGTETTRTILPYLGENTYYWRVAAIDRLRNTGAWSDSRVIYLDTQAPTISADSPPDGALTKEQRPTFAWTWTGGVSARLQVADSSSFAFVSAQIDTTVNSVRLASALDSGRWYWRVIGMDSAGNAETTASRYFRVDTTGNLYAPVAIASMTSRRHLLLGETAAVNGSSSYDSDGVAITYLWTITPASGVSISDSAASTATCTFATTGFYTITLRVTDGDSLTFSDSLTVRATRVTGDLVGAGSSVPDGVLDAADIVVILQHFKRRIGDGDFDPTVDITNDGRVDSEDLFQAGKYYGQ